MTTIRCRHQRRVFLHAVCLVGVLATVGATAQPAPDVVWSTNTHNYFVSPVAISPDGTLVASAGTNNSIRLANLADGSTVRHLSGHSNLVGSIAFSPDGTLLASTAEDRTLRLWDVPGGTLLRTISQGGGNLQFTAVAFHPDGQHVAADRNRTNVVLWKVSDGTPVWEAFGTAWEIQSIAFSPDGLWVATAGGNRGLDVKIRVRRTSDGQLLQSLTTSNTYGVRQLAFSPDGQWLAAGCYVGGFSGGVEIWRTADWTQHRRLPILASTLAFSPDGKSLLTQHQTSIDFWTVPDGRKLLSLGPLESRDYGGYQSIAVSPEGDRIVTANFVRSNTPNGTVTQSLATAIRFPMILTIGLENRSFATFQWIGNSGRSQVQRRFLDDTNWVNVGTVSSNRSMTLPLDGAGAFFRVIEVAD